MGRPPMHHHQLLETEVEGITAALEHPEVEDSLEHPEVEDSLADLDIPEVQGFPEDPDTLEDMDLMEIHGTQDSIRIPRVTSSAT